MLNLKQFKGFGIICGDNSREANRLLKYSLINDTPFKIIPNKGISCPEEYVPCGSVEWCLQSLGRKVTPDYYPAWLSQHLHRKVWKEDKWLLEKVFIKPSDRYKRFTGFVTSGTYKKKKRPPFWCSEIVQFDNEWRYYISGGKILCGEWYWGDEINTPEAPELNIESGKSLDCIDIPKDYYGAVDFGRLKSGELALVEANHPFACGWYGDKDELYFQWLVDGWEHMKNENLL